MLNTLRKRMKSEDGFTLIELLVVILIIGILAAIAIPSFLNQKDKGEDAKAKSSARQTQTALETWYTDNGTYVSTRDDLAAIEPTTPPTNPGGANPGTPGTMDLTTSANPDNYSITVWSKNGRYFRIAKSGNTITRSCGPANTGGCNATSSW